MIFFFFGFDPNETDKIMPRIVEKLDLGYTEYSAVTFLERVVYSYDSTGAFKSKNKAICVPGFERIRDDPFVLAQLSKELGCPVIMIDAPIVAGIAGALY